MTILDHHRVQKLVDEKWEHDIVPRLCEYIKIPNKSPVFDPDWAEHGHMDAAMQLLTDWLAQQDVDGLTYEVVTLEGRTPTLFCDIAASEACTSPRSVFLYGHYDKQPEFDGWDDDLGPWKPVLRDGRLYGRGGADDGYSLFGSILAIQAIQQQGQAHPRCTILIEGCEESGSYDLPFYVQHLKDKIADPALVVCLDAGCANYNQLWLTTSLRGMVIGTLTVKILTEGQHSGLAGGIVPSTFRILRQLLDRLESSVSGTMCDGLQVDIPASAKAAAEDVARTVGTEIYHQFPWVDGAQPDGTNLTELVLDNCWRASLATVGLSGAPEIQNAGNTLRPETSAKLAIRIPPTLDADAAATLIKWTLEQDPPYGAQVSFDLETHMSGWCAPEEEAWLQTALAESADAYFGAPVAHMGMGGSIPFMKMLGDAYPTTQFVVTGVLGPASNAHGPNEFLEISTGKRVTACMAEIIAQTANALNQ